MTRIFLVSFFFGFFFGYILNAKADDSTTPSTQIASTLGRSSTSVKSPATPRPISENQLYIGLGGNAGAASLSDATDPDMKSSGSFSEALLVGSLETRDFVFDLGFGAFSSRITGARVGAASSSSGLTLNNYEMTKSGELAELGARYRLTDSIEVGAFAQMLFGSDVGFEPSLFSSGNTTAFLGGADALYSFSFLGLKWKAGGRAFSSVGLEDRKLTAFQGVVETSLPIL